MPLLNTEPMPIDTPLQTYYMRKITLCLFKPPLLGFYFWQWNIFLNDTTNKTDMVLLRDFCLVEGDGHVNKHELVKHLLCGTVQGEVIDP